MLALGALFIATIVDHSCLMDVHQRDIHKYCSNTSSGINTSSEIYTLIFAASLYAKLILSIVAGSPCIFATINCFLCSKLEATMISSECFVMTQQLYPWMSFGLEN
jgi:hypothetical protein